MTAAEREYLDHLRLGVEAGELLEAAYERFRLRLADDTTYTPDFDLIEKDGAVVFVEFKETRRVSSAITRLLPRYAPFWEDDSRVKFKLAAELYPHFAFRAVRKLHPDEGFGWEVFERFNEEE
jgi:hypothetical protein